MYVGRFDVRRMQMWVLQLTMAYDGFCFYDSFLLIFKYTTNIEKCSRKNYYHAIIKFITNKYQ